MGKLQNFIDVLTPAEVEKMHSEVLTVLERVGIRVPHQKVRNMCAKAGFRVDETAQCIRFPPELVNELIQTNRPKEQPTGPIRAIRGNISTQVFIVDYPGNTQRRGTLDDVRKGILLTDQLMNYGSSKAIVIPSDYPSDRTDLVSFREIYLYSKRPGGTYILSPETARGILEMSRVMGKKPAYLLETVSPLGFMTSSLEMACIFAEAGMPIETAPMAISGASAPMSIWGTCVLEISETIATNLIIYALTGKFNNFLSFSSHTLDMRTMLCSFGSPNQALFGLVAGQMGRFYGYGSGSNSALTDACVSNFQCGFEKVFNGLFALMGGTAEIGCQGIVGADQGISMEQLVLDNDWLDAYKHVSDGVEYDEEALNLIQEIGIAGSYLAEPHTVENMHRVIWKDPSGKMWRDQWQPWQEQGMPNLYAQAHEVVEQYTQGWQNADPVVPPSIAEEINRIYKETLRRLDRKHENARA